MNDINQLKRTLLTAQNPIMSGEAQSLRNGVEEKDVVRMLSDVGTGIWRIQSKRDVQGVESTKEELDSILRIIESISDMLLRRGIEIKDHTGEILSGGEALRIVAFQHSPGLARETVIETIRPTIFYRSKLIQMGEVIVGMPDPLNESPAE